MDQTTLKQARPSLHVGQLNLPDRADFRVAFEDIFSRGHYANHGPLERELDAKLADHFGVRHAISVVNGTIALIMLLKALEVSGEVITTAFTFPATAQSVVWAGLKPVFCDVDPDSQMLTADRVAELITPSTAAILGVHVWGRACDPFALEELARNRNLKLVFDAAHGTSCGYAGRKIGSFGDAEIFSFHFTKVLSGAEGGCITTNDDALAARLRVMRSFHDGTGDSGGLLRMNAKMSEAQAAMMLLGLDRLDVLIGENRKRYELYRQMLADIPGISFLDYAGDNPSNHQFIVASVNETDYGLSRDALLGVLEKERVIARRYFAPGIHRLAPFSDDNWNLPVTDRLCQSLIQLPTGQAVLSEYVAEICGIIRSAQSGHE